MTPMTTMYSVCPDCRAVREDTVERCHECASTKHGGEAWLHRTLAEAAAAGMWLAEGYHILDFTDPYFRPRR